ncbi:alpha/beta fold hydrolase [Pseudonocardia humida]|uniref:Alpha/beta fold hydrolase n=1 Tax=Pseudonocardia humida TaxID=2800819 RepID=A0ABT0ZVU8_9PSEU|nr:alpha/beta fold hydrolase [Pseudonocardia humida]MCO1654870.1 alpha/beta fold hydrolase [Pseudonocardia humida]
MHLPRRAVVVVLAAVLAVIATITVSTTVASADAPALTWGPCPDGPGAVGMECATLDVPVDPADPDGRTITLALGRLPATGTAEGSVLVNFGGPGAPGIPMLRDQAAESFAALRARMDVVTWDTRGYGGLFGGRSTGLDCDFRSLARPTPPFPADQAAFDAITEANRAVAQACRDTDPVLFDHMDSASHAHDMEAIRRALGQERLTFYGASYGGMFAQAYARLFPDRVRAMVLDGTANHSTADWDAEVDEQARDGEEVFDRFVAWCAAEPACALHGTDVRARWLAVVAAADREPLPVPGTDIRYTGRDLQGLLRFTFLAGPPEWPAMAAAVVTAEGGDGSGFVPERGNPYPVVSTVGLTECQEIPGYDDHRDMVGTVERVRAVGPALGVSMPIVAHVLTCAGWPAPLANPPAPLPDGLPPLLGLGTWTDFPGTERAVRQVPGSVAVRHDGPGHVLYRTGNACAIEVADRYLTDLELPEPGTTC